MNSQPAEPEPPEDGGAPEIDGEPRPAPPRFDAVLRKAILSQGLTLDQLRRRLADGGAYVTVPTLSKWQNGRSYPTGAGSAGTVVLLERELGMPTGTLQRLVPPPQPRGPRGRTSRVDRFPELSSPTRAASLGGNPRLRWVVWHETVTIDAAGRLLSIAEHSTVRALQDGVGDVHMAYHDDHGRPSSDMIAEAGEGCSLTSVTDVPGKNTRMWVLSLNDVLMAGQSTTFSWAYRPSHPFRFSDHTICVVDRVPVLAIELVYPAEVAVHVQHIAQRSADSAPHVVNNLHPSSSGRSMLVIQNAAPGGHGLAWSVVPSVSG